MSFEFAWRFCSFANDNGGHPRRAVQYRPPDYPGLLRLEVMLAVARGDIDPADFLDNSHS
jgi:hypothetical protein